jgi:hypothetical protein
MEAPIKEAAQCTQAAPTNNSYNDYNTAPTGDAGCAECRKRGRGNPCQTHLLEWLTGVGGQAATS